MQKQVRDKAPTTLFLCDFNIQNPPDFIVQQIKLARSYGNVLIIAKNTSGSNIELLDLKIRLIEFHDSKIDSIIFRFFRRFCVVRNLEIIFKPHATLKVISHLIRLRPTLVHIHGVGGGMIPVILIPIISRFLRINVMVTHHGFSILNGGVKLYPADINLNKEHGNHLSGIDSYFGKPLNIEVGRTNDILLTPLQKLIVFLLNKSSFSIGLCMMQHKIFSLYKLRIDKIISNFCNPCSCQNLSENSTMTFNHEIRVLFLGRPIGKGLERVVNLVKCFPNLHLYVAGNQDSADYVMNSGLDNSKFTYLGYVDKRNLYPIMHKMHFVASLSDCFDTFPTVVLEALSHDCIPLVTPSTGVAQLLSEIDERMVWPMHSHFDLCLMAKVVSQKSEILDAIRFSNFQKDFDKSIQALNLLYERYLA